MSQSQVTGISSRQVMRRAHTILDCPDNPCMRSLTPNLQDASELRLRHFPLSLLTCFIAPLLSCLTVFLCMLLYFIVFFSTWLQAKLPPDGTIKTMRMCDSTVFHRNGYRSVELISFLFHILTFCYGLLVFSPLIKSFKITFIIPR